MSRFRRNGTMFARARTARNRVIHIGKRLKSVHSTAYIHQTARVARDLVADEYVFIAPGCHIDPGVTVGRYSMLASHVAIVGDDHVINLPGTPIQFAGRPAQSRTTIEPDVWIGYRAIVRRGITIGRGAVVGAHSVVTKDVAPYSIVAGAPALQIGWRFENPADVVRHDVALAGPVISPSFASPLTSGRRTDD